MPTDKPKEVFDFLASFPEGMNSGVDPLLLPKSQLAYARNGTLRGDFFRPRPAFRKINLAPASVSKVVTVTVDVSQAGRTFIVDGVQYTTSQSFTWVVGSTHTVSIVSPQTDGGGNVWVFDSWSDGGSLTHAIAPTADVTITANLTNTGTLPTAPATPANLSAIAGNGSVALSWTASTGATSYNVLRSTTPGTEAPLAAGITGTTYTDATAVNGTTYYYVVTATNGVGTSANSSEVSATPTLSPPLQPTGYAVTFVGGLPVFTWNASPGATSYDIMRVNGGIIHFSGIVTLTYTDAAGIPGTLYNYYLSAVNSAGSSGLNLIIQFTFPPAAPTGLVATTPIHNVALQWNVSTGATGYNVYRSTTSGSGYVLITTTNNHHFTDHSVASGTTYYYVVTAVVSAGGLPFSYPSESAYSSQVSATPH